MYTESCQTGKTPPLICVRLLSHPNFSRKQHHSGIFYLHQKPFCLIKYLNQHELLIIVVDSSLMCPLYYVFKWVGSLNVVDNLISGITNYYQKALSSKRLASVIIYSTGFSLGINYSPLILSLG